MVNIFIFRLSFDIEFLKLEKWSYVALLIKLHKIILYLSYFIIIK